MLIICRIFHISTRYFSCAFAIGLCLISQPFIGSLFLGCARGVFLLPPHITTHMFVAAIALLRFFGGWYVFDFMIFLRRAIVFLILGALSRVCRLFALFSPCWLPINTFFSFAFPRCRRSVPMFSVVFSTFHVKHCCFLYEILPLLCSFFTVSGAIFCGFCCLVFLILAC